jgi:hypothetical protein
MKQINTRHALLFVASLVVVAFLINGSQLKQKLIILPDSGSPRVPPTTEQNGQVNSGVLTINSYEWHGVACLKPGWHITGRILTKNVWCHVRLDKDDTRVFTLHPDDGQTKDTLVITNPFNVMEWKVLPGQSVTQGNVAWSFDPP